MFTEGIYPIGDGLLDIDEERLKGLLVPHDINDIYDVEQTPFARGKFAAVRRAIHKNSGVHFAAKFLKRRRRAQSSDKEIKHEIAVLMLCDGAENIVKLNAVHESRSDTALLLELATGGELQTFLDNEECLSESQARICMREVLKALQFLHKRSIAHLDLKPQNILLTSERIEDGLKLCDFGISRVVAEGTNVREIVGTPDYVAPEVLQYEPLSLLTDIWSVGVLAYVLLSGFSPFGGETKQETFLNISQCALTFPDKLFGGVSTAAIDFIRRALRIKPNDRMSAAGCLEHSWLKDECAIDRQIFSNISKKATASNDDEGEDDEVDDDDDDEDEDDEADEEVEAEQELVEEVDDQEEENSTNASKMDSSDTELESQQNSHNSSNGKNATTAATTTNGTTTITKYSHNGTKSPTATTTAMLTVPATRATTIPLCNMPLQQQQQQQLHIAARCHSSDSNKENHFLAMKKILPTTNATATTIATIEISPSGTSTSQHIVATITLPRNSSNDKNAALAAQQQCLFPDAPTTPKVIRKAPTTDTSPTSVKALVKKFQLEGNTNAEKSAPALSLHLKEQHQANYQQQQQTPQQQTQQQHVSSRKSCATPPTSKTHEKTTFVNGSSSSMRRSSEPLTAVHKKSTPTSPTLSVTTSATTATVASYKSSCVLCITCSGSNSNITGCRHSAVSAANGNNVGSSNNSIISTTSPTSNGGSSSSLLLGNHHQRQYHHAHTHHHHVVVAKSAANNLSLDQGIIC